MDYVNIDINVQRDPDEEKSYWVTATTQGNRRKSATERFYLSPDEWIEVETSLQFLEARGATAQGHVQKVRDFGKRLFDALIRGKVRDIYDERKQRARDSLRFLRVRLTLVPLELVVIPWELLYDERDSEYLCLTQHPKTVLLRSVENVGTIKSPTSFPPLIIVGMRADPKGSTIVGKNEQKNIEDALKSLIDNQQVQIIWKPGKHSELIEHRYSVQKASEAEHGGSKDHIDIFHFIGHGSFDAEKQQGYLEFEDNNRNVRLVTAEEFRGTLHARTKLVVLNACESARGNQFNRFSNIAHSLASTGIPAVVAMQFKIRDTASHRFAKTFYTLLANGVAIDEAFAEARYDIRSAAENQDYLDWAAPLLYVSASNILSFKLARKTDVISTPTPPAQASAASDSHEEKISDASNSPALASRTEKAGVPGKRSGGNRILQRGALPLWKKISAIVAIITILALGIVVIVVIKGRATTTTYNKLLGGLDLSSYCTSLHYQEVIAVADNLDCSGQSSIQIDMKQACNWQYPQYRNTLTAETTNSHSPDNWQCYDSAHQPKGGISNMNGFCISQGYDNASSDGNQTDTWSCHRPPQRQIDMTQACIRQYPKQDVQAHKIDNNTWECYGPSTP